MCHAENDWIRSLSTVLLGLRTNVLDTGASPAEYVYDTTIRVPGKFVLPKSFADERHFLLEQFREQMRLVKPVPVEHRHKRGIFVFKNSATCSDVFMKVDPIKKSLESPYSGPHKVLNRVSDRVYVNGVERRECLENLKPTYILNDDFNAVNDLTLSYLRKRVVTIRLTFQKIKFSAPMSIRKNYLR